MFFFGPSFEELDVCHGWLSLGLSSFSGFDLLGDLINGESVLYIPIVGLASWV